MIALVLLGLVASDAPLAPPIVVLSVDDAHACVSEDELSRLVSARRAQDDTALDVVVRTDSSANGVDVRVTARALTVEGVDDVVVDLSFSVAPEACQTVSPRIARAIDAALTQRTEERLRAKERLRSEEAARAALEDEAARADEASLDEGDATTDAHDDEDDAITGDTVWFARPRAAIGLGLGALPIVPDARATLELAIGHQSYPSLVVGLSTMVFAPVAAGERVAVVEPIALTFGVAFDRWFDHVALGARVLGSGGVALAHDASLDVSRLALRPYASVQGGVLLMWRYGPTVEVGVEVPVLPLAVVDDATGDVFTFPPGHGFVRVGYAIDLTW